MTYIMIFGNEMDFMINCILKTIEAECMATKLIFHLLMINFLQELKCTFYRQSDVTKCCTCPLSCNSSVHLYLFHHLYHNFAMQVGLWNESAAHGLHILLHMYLKDLLSEPEHNHTINHKIKFDPTILIKTKANMMIP